MPSATPCPRISRRREEIITVEGEERFCVCCGEERCRIGYEEKESAPVRYFVRVIKREKLACRKCPEGGVVTAASGGAKIVEKGKLSDAVVVDVLIKKYPSHLPLYPAGCRFAQRSTAATELAWSTNR
jgi:hypothetical protein